MDFVLNNFLNGFRPGNLYTYEEYIDISLKSIEEANPELLTGTELTNYNYRKINRQRTNRIQKTFIPQNNIVDLVNSIKTPLLWLAITEDWCGDSAQNLPYFYKYLGFNELMQFRIILRDENLELIDNFIKDGNPRSIPKIIIFDKNGYQLGEWGPRPKFAQDLVSQLRAEGYSKEEFNKELHSWYAKNKGKEIEKELASLLRNIKSKLNKNTAVPLKGS